MLFTETSGLVLMDSCYQVTHTPLEDLRAGLVLPLGSACKLQRSHQSLVWTHEASRIRVISTRHGSLVHIYISYETQSARAWLRLGVCTAILRAGID